MKARDNTRYRPRHAWYLADAQLLIRKLQELAWPLSHHVALGGGVLNHGYSEKDLDIYILPIYEPGLDHQTLQDQLTSRLDEAGLTVMADMMVQSGKHGNPAFEPAHCFSAALRCHDEQGRAVDVFVVRAMPATKQEPAPEGQAGDSTPIVESDDDNTSW